MKGKVLRHNCGSGLFKEYHIRRQRPRTGNNVLEPLVLESNNNFKKEEDQNVFFEKGNVYLHLIYLKLVLKF
jgi:hypothetical protein